ncbi:hypothetical protein R1sor_013651 [Riccia sorocarpa]|uniref:Transmembrane protein 256 homolog n=1 Tax=Riccia sorocarpa TaxID=122646 RepID=A0ABD3HA53_9MARC
MCLQRDPLADERMSQNHDEEEQDEGLHESLLGAGAAGSATRPLGLYASDAHIWHKVAGFSGMLALAAGTYGSHIFKPQNLLYKDVWNTANLYHLTHTAALLAVPLTKRPQIFGTLLTFGIVAFSGSCYAAALMEDRSYSLPAPFGGFSFIAAWASLMF